MCIAKRTHIHSYTHLSFTQSFRRVVLYVCTSVIKCNTTQNTQCAGRVLEYNVPIFNLGHSVRALISNKTGDIRSETWKFSLCCRFVFCIFQYSIKFICCVRMVYLFLSCDQKEKQKHQNHFTVFAIKG